jgi:hypothetical protein
MGMLAQRYAQYPVAYEIWNEANRAASFAGSATAYSQMTCAAYRTIKSQGSDITVVMGATAGTDLGWLTTVLAAGSAQCFDAVSTHPYTWGSDPFSRPSTFQPTSPAATVHSLMTSYGVGSKPIWFTEFGWPASLNATAPTFEHEATLQQQADFTERFLRWTAANNPYVTVAMTYTALDIGNKKTTFEGYMGVLGTDFTPKPVYDRLEALYSSAPVSTAAYTRSSCSTDSSAGARRGPRLARRTRSTCLLGAMANTRA